MPPTNDSLHIDDTGSNAGATDGIWGDTTKNALIEYLSTKGLKFDGSLDNNEFELLEIFSFRYNIDESLPAAWVNEFKNIMGVLQEHLPIDKNFNEYVKTSTMDIYAWNGKVKNPFSEKRGMSGASISGDGRTRWMVLEIPENEFKYDSLHRYSVIVHEYFHIYQIGLSKDRMDPKWLNEGGAKVLEEMFVQQYYGRSSLQGDFERAELWSDEVFTNPKLYEKFETSSKETADGWMDMNYAGSAFIFLTLVKELQKQSISEQEAFKLVFRDFWTEKSKGSKIMSIDLKEVEKIKDVYHVVGDFLDSENQRIITDYFPKKIDLVVSDMAVNTTGNKNLDSIQTGELSLTAMHFAIGMLRPKGIFLSKTFMGSTFNEIVENAKKNFKESRIFKPPSSRKDSKESFIICRNLR